MPYFFGEFNGRFLRRLSIQIHTNDVRPFLRDAVGRCFANAAARAHHNHHVPRQLFFRRHALQLRLFQQPIFDVKRLLPGQALVLADRFGGAHYFDGQGVEFGRNAALAFVFAPGNQPHAGMRMTVGFGSRMAGELGCLHAA
jgi:hypothetical protein